MKKTVASVILVIFIGSLLASCGAINRTSGTCPSHDKNFFENIRGKLNAAA